MDRIIKLLNNNDKLPLLFRLIGKEDLYPLERKSISIFSSVRNQTKLSYTYPSNKPIAKVLNIRNGKIL